MILELGCGSNPHPEATLRHDRVAHDPWVDVTHELEVLPWPWADGSAEGIIAYDVMEHLTLDDDPADREDPPALVEPDVDRNIHLCNIDTATQSVSISIGVAAAYSDTKALYKTFSLPANGVHIANVNIVLGASETLYGIASAASKIVATISGVDL